ncbi:hypothetical protein [Microbispora sp. KK1-11]|uniref:hypothetical protein n=1 Tax=Microbispora sp. KK1-11 TaxID=2053005 RepID=UPI001157D77F|nr:hypothetical protein [Microbispora sp. KK1-11]TQS28104.1 hypothetical protein FLW16_17000 [Microbispora sp. KK1-11]
MTAATPGRGRGEHGGQSGQGTHGGQGTPGGRGGQGTHGGQDPLTPPDPTGLEAWIRQVLGLAGARASAFAPPLPPTPSAGPGHPGRPGDAHPDGKAD